MAINIARRKFVAALSGAVAWPLAARAQQAERMRRIGVLRDVADDPVDQAQNAAFLQGLQQLGWTEGRNVRIDIRWGAGNAADTRKYAVELVSLAPDVILAPGGLAIGPLLEATRTVPIVFVIVPDPVGAGYVQSLSRPGGNATGFMMFEYGLSGEVAGTAQGDRAGRDASGDPSGYIHSRRGRAVRNYPVGGAVGWRGRDPN